MRHVSRIVGEIFVGLDLFAIGVAMIAATWLLQRETPFTEWTAPTVVADLACWLAGALVATHGIGMIRTALRPPPRVPVARAERRG